MHALVPLPVALPLFGAALLAGAGRWLPRWVADVVAISIAIAAAAAGALLAYATHEGPILYWFGGFTPEHGIAIGIPFTVEPLGAGLTSLNALLGAAALAFSLRYFDTYEAHFHALVLAFIAALAGFAMTGDVFDMFVFFGLLSVTGIALTGYKSQEKGPIEGAVAFGVTETIAAFLFLVGLSLLYGRAGTLDMAGIGRRLGAHGDALVVVAFAVMLSGLFVKAAVVPFHFWLADAHAVAPTPASVLFSGVMVEVGLWGAAKLYGALFRPALLEHEHGLRVLLLAAGALTAILGGVMCVLERNIKRMLALSTVSHVGVMLIGLGLLDGGALGGAAMYVVGHAFSKGALFLGAGAVLHSLGSIDETELHGRGEDVRELSIVFFLGALGLASFVPFATCRGTGGIDEAAHLFGQEWIAIPTILSSGLTAGAVTRVALRVFFGLGTPDPPAPDLGDEVTEEPETSPSPEPVPAVMWIPMAALLAGSVVFGLAPGVAAVAHASASNALDTHGYASWVLDGAVAPRASTPEAPAFAVRHGIFAVLIGAVVVACTIAPRRIAARAPRALTTAWRRSTTALRSLQSGRATDYAVWIACGTAVFAGVLLIVYS